MQKVMFTSEECDIIINGIETHHGTTNYDIDDRKYKEWLIGDADRTFLEHPIFRHNSAESYSIGFNSSRAVCASIRNEKNELNYGWIKRNFNEWVWITISTDVESGKLYFYSNDKLIKVLKNGVLEESPYTFTGKLKKLNSNFYIGKNTLNKNKIVIDFLKKFTPFECFSDFKR